MIDGAAHLFQCRISVLDGGAAQGRLISKSDLEFVKWAPAQEQQDRCKVESVEFALSGAVQAWENDFNLLAMAKFS